MKVFVFPTIVFVNITGSNNTFILKIKTNSKAF